MLLYIGQQSAIRHYMQQAISDDRVKTETITLPLYLYNTDKVSSNEIVINGKLYDIKSISVIDGNAIIEVVNDTAEEKVVKNISAVLDDVDKKTDNNLPNGMINLLTLDYILPPQIKLVVYSSYKETHYLYYSKSLVSRTADILVPPPRTA